MNKKRILMLTILSLFTVILVISATSATSEIENNTIGTTSEENFTSSSSYSSSDIITPEDGSSESGYSVEWGSETTYNEDEDSDNPDEIPEYDGEFIVENITEKYNCWGSEINVWLKDNDENPLILGDDVIDIYWNDGTKSYLSDTDMINLEDIAYDLGYDYVNPEVYDYWLYDDSYDWEGYFDYYTKPVGTYTVTAVCNDQSYNIKPVTFTIKITKGSVKLTPKVYHSASGSYATLKCKVLDSYGQEVDEGTVTFKINGKTYKVKVRNGEAIKKVKLTKAKTYKYTATFNGDNYNSKSASSKVYVYKISKKARTFKIGKYKIVVPLAKYKKLINAKNTNKQIGYTFYTGKKITQKVKIGKKWKTKKNVKVYFNIMYGGKLGGQFGVPNKYSIFLETKYQTPEYDSIKPLLSGHKSRTLISGF